MFLCTCVSMTTASLALLPAYDTAPLFSYIVTSPQNDLLFMIVDIMYTCWAAKKRDDVSRACNAKSTVCHLQLSELRVCGQSSFSLAAKLPDSLFTASYQLDSHGGGCVRRFPSHLYCVLTALQLCLKWNRWSVIKFHHNICACVVQWHSNQWKELGISP